jgi:hypothetical protein
MAHCLAASRPEGSVCRPERYGVAVQGNLEGAVERLEPNRCTLVHCSWKSEAINMRHACSCLPFARPRTSQLSVVTIKISISRPLRATADFSPLRHAYRLAALH